LIRTAQVIGNLTSTEAVAFGAHLQAQRPGACTNIEGEDEADPKAGSISFVSPVALCAPVGHEGIRNHHKTANRGFEFGRIAHRHGDRLHGESSSSRPERAKINFRVGCGCRIEQQGDTVDARRNLLEPLQPLAGYRALDISKTCSVAARPQQARNKPLATGSATVPKMMGIVRGCCRSASVVDVVDERTTSGCDATSC
jgi:hypothetical protein